MPSADQSPATAVYWKVWGVLLALTVVMVVVDSAGLPARVLVAILCVAMLTKATLIAASFMHLRQEGWLFKVSVVLGLAVLGFLLWALMAPDGLRIFDMVGGGT